MFQYVSHREQMLMPSSVDKIHPPVADATKHLAQQKLIAIARSLAPSVRYLARAYSLVLSNLCTGRLCDDGPANQLYSASGRGSARSASLPLTLLETIYARRFIMRIQTVRR